MADVATEPVRFGPRELSDAFAYATEWLGVYVDEVNALNVYPVPDGDTGTNMHLTMQSVRRQLDEERPGSMPEFAHALSYGSLLGARGNSGVILSQILKGFAEVAKNETELGRRALAKALRSATEAAYAAVMKPVEGTILTVVRAVADGAEDSRADEPLALLADGLEAGREALERTPEMLPMLKQAGVVDSGGLGLLHILEGVIAAFEGRALPPPPEITERAQESFEEEEFGFCTEFLLEGVTADTREIQELVAPFGDSLLVVGAEGYVKGHIHTEEPEKLLATVARYGRMVRSKVEDMSEQHSEILATVDATEATAPASGLVVVSDGYGVTKVFRSLGARVVGGGQTNNPSVQDIADAVRSVGADDVLVLPNNKNIIMAAERVDELVAEKRVRVLPTRTIGAGLAAAVLFNETEALDDLYEAMADAAEHARTLEVTTASRTASIDGVSVEEGKPIGLIDGKLRATGDTPEDALLALLGELDSDDYEIGTLFFGTATGEERAEAALAAIEEAHPDLELELQPGAPELYPFVLALE